MNNYINNITIKGKVAKQPTFSKGVKNCLKMTVLTKHTVQTDAEPFEIPTWHNVIVFGERADELLNKISKNSVVEVGGRFTKTKYNGKFYDQIEAVEVRLH